MAAEQDPFAEFGGTQTEDPFKEFGGRSVIKKASANGSGNGSQRSAVGSINSRGFQISTQKDLVNPEQSNIFDQDYAKQVKQAKTYVKPKTKPKTLQEATQDDDSYLGALWNTVVGSVSDAASGAANLMGKMGGANPTVNLLAKAEDFTNGIYSKLLGVEKPKQGGISKFNEELQRRTYNNAEQAGKAIQNVVESTRTSASSKENEERLMSGFDLTNPDAKKIGKALPLMITRLGSDIGLSIPTGGLSFLAQGYKQGLDDYDKSVKQTGVESDNNTRELFGLAYGTINGLFDKLGADAILKNNAVTKTVKNAILKQAVGKLASMEGKVTAEALEQTLANVARTTLNKVKEVGLKSAIAGVTEGGTESIQGGLSDGLKALTNKLSNKNIFNTDEVKEKFWANRVNDLAGGAILGGLAGSMHGIRSTDSYVAERLAEVTTPEEIENLKAEVATEVDNGGLDEIRGTEIINSIDNYSKILPSVPQGLKADQRGKVIQLIDQRNKIDESLKSTAEATTQLDPALQTEEPVLDLENKKESINDQIREVVAGKKYKYKEEEGKFYKQLGEGKQEEITPEYYNLQKQDSIKEVKDNEREDIDLESQNEGVQATIEPEPIQRTTEQIQEPVEAINESNLLTDEEAVSQRAEVDDAIRKFQENNPNIEVDPLDDLPDGVVRTFDRVENNLPTDPVAVKETSEWLYNKYKQLTDLKNDPNRMLTTDQIEFMQEQLGEDITTLENYIQNQNGEGQGTQTAAEPRAEQATEEVQPTPQVNDGTNQSQEIGGQENAIPEQSTAEVDVRQQAGNGEGVGEGNQVISESAAEVRPTEVPSNTETKEIEGATRTLSKPVKLTKAEIKSTSEELGLPEIKLDPKRKDTQVASDANEYIKDDGKLFKLVDKLNSGEKVAITDTEVAALTQGLANRRAQYDSVRGKILNAVKEGDQRAVDSLTGQRDALLKDIADIQTAGRKASREAGRSLRQFNVSKIEDNSLEGFLDRAIVANGGKIPDKEVQDMARKAYEEYQQAQDQYQSKINELENRIAQLENDAVLARAKKETEARTRQRRTGTLEEKRAKIREERKVILKELFDAAKRQSGNLNAGLNLELAKPIYKLAKNYIEEGIVTLDEVVSKIYDDIKDNIEGISERDIRDAISGYGRELNKTRSELQVQIQELRTQARMISAIEDLESGLSRWKPNSAKHKEASERIKELREQLKILIGDETRLSAYKTRTKNRIKEYERRIKEGDFIQPDKKVLQLDEEARVFRDMALRIKHDYAIELEKYRLSQRTKMQKAIDLAVNVQGLVKSLKATWDLSAPFRQGLIASVAHPQTAFEAFTRMHKAAWNKEYFERWQNDLKDSDLYPLMKEVKLALTDTTSPELMAREEDWTSNLAEKIPGLGRLTKGSERAYSFYLNYLRANIFTDGVQQLMESGFTFENNPEEFKSLAKVINNETGRGGLGKFEKYNNIASLVLWSPRLMMSRINTFTSILDTSYTPRARQRAALDLLKFIGFASTTMFLASSNDDWEVEYDPRSSNFGKIKVGNNRYSLMGGMEGYIVAMAKILTSEYKNKKGKITKLEDAPFGGMTELEIAGRFLRGKLAPDLGIVFNLLDHKDVVGNSYTVWDIPDEVIPLSAVEMIDSYNRGGTAEILRTLPFTTYGVGVSTYDVNEKKKRKPGVFESLYYKAIGK